MIVDEAATASTPKLAHLARLADQHHWRIVLVGDPRQFAAVGRGGMFSHLVDTFGATELAQVIGSPTNGRERRVCVSEPVIPPC